MKKISILLLSTLMLLGQIQAQQSEKKQLQLRDAMNPAVYPQRLSALSWQGNSDKYTYMDFRTNSIMQGDLDGETRTLLGTKELNAALPEGEEAIKRMPMPQWKSADAFSFMHNNKLFTYNLFTQKLSLENEHPQGAENLETATNGNFAFTMHHNLYVAPYDQETAVQVTHDATREVVYGEAAHRREFGITNGIFWSPKGNKVAFYRMDQTMVTDYPLVDFMAPTAEPRLIKYPMAGGASHHVTVGVYDVTKGTTVYLNTGEPAEQYLTNITWSPDEEMVYVAVVNREQNEMKLQAYKAATGVLVKTLFTETDEKYVEPEHGPIFLPENPEQFFWFSERNGYDHLYLYNTEGELIHQVTKGSWEVTEFLGFDEKEKYAYFMATEASPLERNAYRVHLKKLEVERLTPDKGSHSVQLHPSGKYLLDSYSNRETPYRAQLILSKKGEAMATIMEAENPLEDYETGEMEFHELKATDGTPLYSRLIKPANFDPTKKYPTIVYLYGGPHAQLVTERWGGGAQMFLHYMASQGYVVFTLDNRGSAHRGIEFEQQIFRNMGTLEIEDQMVGINWLKEKEWVDGDRMGVYGWSYGGFMATSLLLRKPGVFKAAVAGGPVIDWKYYEVMYGERYMDRPQDNPEGYKKASLLNYVDQLEGRLLIIHGMQDSTVVPQHSMAFVRECVKQGKYIDYFPYPTHEHNVRGLERIHLLGKIEDFFKLHL
jgi:dipeptidyl-peptidase-4